MEVRSVDLGEFNSNDPGELVLNFILLCIPLCHGKSPARLRQLHALRTELTSLRQLAGVSSYLF